MNFINFITQVKLITLSGIDGSGKTTQTDLLEKYLKDQGKKVYRFHVLSFSFANKLLKRRPEDKKSRSVTKASTFKIFLRKIALKIDLFCFKFFCQKLEKESYDFLVTDRYFFDQVINILYLQKSVALDFCLKKIIKKIKKPDLFIFIDIAPGVAMSRERKIDQGLEYLEQKRKLYKSFEEDWSMTTIDGEQNKEEVFEEIKKCIHNI